MKIERRDDLHTWPEEELPVPDELLRELVDDLPENQAHLISRVFFGGAPLAHAAFEIQMAVPTARAQLVEALGVLGAALRQED